MSKNEKIALAALLLLAAFSLILSARNFYRSHTVLTPTFGGNYTEGIRGQPAYINPLLARGEPDLSLTRLVFSGLYKLDGQGQLVPDLADGQPEISPDQKQYVINIKRNARWHNGKSVTADDVVFTINLLKDPAYKSPLRPLWQATAVEKLSDFSVKFTTQDISGPFAYNLTLPVLSKNIWGKVDSQNFLLSQFNLEAVGSGPYAIKEIKKLPSGKIEAVTLNANTDYYQNRPKISQITLKFYNSDEDLANAFHSREIDGFGYVPLGSSLAANNGAAQGQTLSEPMLQYQVVFFNLNNKILSDIKVRRALALATDRQAIIDQVFKGKALAPSSPFLLDGRQNRAEISNPEPERAAALLDAAGWKTDPGSGQRSKKNTVLEFTLATNDSPANAKAAEMLSSQWQALGIKVSLKVLPTKELTDSLIKPRDFDALLFPQKFGADPDPFLFWHSSQTRDPGYNLTGFSDATADKLITEARTTTDKNLRRQNYQQFNNLVFSQTPLILLDQTEFIYSLDEKIKNAQQAVLFDTADRFNTVADWYISQKRVWK